MRYYIVIPTYNEEQFIALTLQSLAEQTVVPTKVIVVNDSSTALLKLFQILLKNTLGLPWSTKLQTPFICQEVK